MVHPDIIPMFGRAEENDDLSLAIVPLELRTECLLNRGRCRRACRYANLGGEAPWRIRRVEWPLSDLSGPKGGRLKREGGETERRMKGSVVEIQG